MISFEFWATEKWRIVQRLAFVWAAAFLIALALWSLQSFTDSFLVQLVYSLAISTCIWFLTDVMRMALFKRGDAPYLYSVPIRMVYAIIATLLGYGLGTLVGDAYSGHSTFELLTYDLNRFVRILLISVGVSLGFMGYFYQKERLASAQRQAAESHLKLLESQLEPHMLFNTLANLRVLIQTDSAKAITMLDALNNYLRATLSGSRESWHPLNNEFVRLKDYLALMQVRMGARLSFTIDCPAPLSHQLIPPLLLQPIVENAIKHGLEPAIAGGAIHISAKQVADQLVLSVCDTGLGSITQEQLAAGHGFGLSQVRERLATVYGGRSQLAVVQSAGYSTCLQISLPWRATP